MLARTTRTTYKQRPILARGSEIQCESGLLFINKCVRNASPTQAMFVDETSTLVLFHKGEAIVDRYLDTASQPWIKVRTKTLYEKLIGEYDCKNVEVNCESC